MTCPTFRHAPQTLEGHAAWVRGQASIRGGGMGGLMYIDRAAAVLAADPRVQVDEAAVQILLAQMEMGLRQGQAELLKDVPKQNQPGNGAIN